MNSAQQALHTVVGVFMTIVRIVLDAIGVAEHALRDFLTRLGVTGETQSVVLLIAFVLLLVAALQLFGGVLRFLVVLFLILLVVSAFVPSAHI